MPSLIPRLALSWLQHWRLFLRLKRNKTPLLTGLHDGRTTLVQTACLCAALSEPRVAGRQPDWTGDMAASGVPGAAYLAYSVFGATGSAVYIAYNPYEGPVPAILPQPPLG